MPSPSVQLTRLWWIKPPRWSRSITIVVSFGAIVFLAVSFLLLVSTRNPVWSVLLALPVIASGLLFGPFSGAVAGFGLLVAAGVTEDALGKGLLHGFFDYVALGLVVAIVGWLVGLLSRLLEERGRLLEELRATSARALREEKNVDRSEERYHDIFENSAVSLWEEDITELLARLKGLGFEEGADFRRYFEEHPDFVVEAIRSTRVIDVNRATVALYEARSKEELFGSLDRTLDMTDTVLLESFRDTLVAIAEGRRYYRGESTARTLKGRDLDIAVSSYFREDEAGNTHMIVNVMDITDRKHAERRVVHLNRLYAVLSEINHAIARASDREALLREVCRIAIEQGGLRMAWVGFVDEIEHLVRPVASAGFTGSYLDSIRISTEDVPEGRGPAGRSVREGRVAIFGDMWHEPGAEPWRDAAIRHGYRSCASVPLRSGERSVGAFIVYSEEAWFFNEDQVGLIEEIGSDLSFALHALEEETSRRQAEDTLRRSEARLRSVMENAGDAVVIVDGNGEITLWNAAATALFGYTPEEVVSKPLSTVVPQEFLDRIEELRAAAPQNDERHIEAPPLVFSGATKDGREIEVEFTLAAWQVDGERYVTGIFRDVTERTRTEEKMREQAQLLDISSEAIMVRDRRERIRFWNRGAERLYGWTSAEALGRNDMELLHLPDDERHAAVLAVYELGTWSGELNTTSKEGERLTVQASWTLLRDRSGEPSGVLVVCSDISEKKLNEAQRLRNQRLESLGRLAGAIAHDLNNILTPVLGGMETLELEELPEESRETVGIIRSSVLRGANLIRQILTFASAGRGRYQELRVSDIIDEVSKMVGGTMPAGAQLECEIAPDLWAINGDLTQIHRVVMNLCVNARDALHNGGRVSVRAENLHPRASTRRMHIDALPIRYVHLSIEDTGVGIEPSVIENIFDPFFTTKEKGNGTGLGLATVLSIVKSHGGFIDVKSEPGAGSRFDVYLPAAHEQGAVLLDEPASPAPRGNGELILVVDDEEAIRSVVRDILKTHGYRTLVAQNGVDAMRIYREEGERIDASMIDAVMPKMDGVATIKAIREIDPDAKMMIVSGLVSHAQVEVARGEGIEEFVSKPFTTDELLRSLRRVLSS